MLKIYDILVDGKVVKSLPLELRADGTLWSSGGWPLINRTLLAAHGISDRAYVKACEAGRFDGDMMACCMILGENSGGRVVRDKHEYFESRLTTSDHARRKVSGMFRAAELCDRSEDDVEYHRLHRIASDSLRAWERDFPEEAAHASAARLRARASDQRDKARGAWLCDLDGWSGTEDQRRRYDCFLAEAARLEEMANAVEPDEL